MNGDMENGVTNMKAEVEPHPGLSSLAQAAKAMDTHDNAGASPMAGQIPTTASVSSPANTETEQEFLESAKGKKMKRLACVECRQQKSKCDAHERQPNPCTRCTKRHLPCTLQPDYKRTYKRARLAQIEKEYQDLKKTLEDAGAQGLLQNLERNTALLMSGRHFPPTAPGSPSPQMAPHPQNILPPIRSALLDNPPPNFNRGSPANSPSMEQMSSKSASTQPQDPTVKNKPTVIRSGIDNNINNLFGNKLPEPRPVDRTFTVSEDVMECEQKQLGDVVLSSAEIKLLFRDFCENYHPIFPVVDVTKGPERIYRACPALFWTMMFIALRRYHAAKSQSNGSDTTSQSSHQHSGGAELYLRLSPLLKSVLAEITISPITRYIPSEVDQPLLNVSSVYSVQAFLLYTFWPPLTSSLSADTSWHTIGIALFQAIRIGLHSPGQTDSFNNLKKNNLELLNEHIRTWVGCNIVSQTIATAFGFPAFVQFDAAVLAACRPGSQINIPASMGQMMQIQHLEDQVAKTLNNNPMDPLGLVDATERLPLLQVLLEQLDELEIRLSTDLTAPLDDVRRFSLLATRLHILTYHFLDTSKVASFELRRGFIRVYNAALALVAHAQSSNIRDKKFMKYLPGVYILTIWQSACIISRLIHSPYSDVLDTGAGKELYLCAIKLAMKASVMKHDMAYRSSGIMRNMWSLFKILNEKGSVSSVSVTIRTRMCASIFFDCLWVLREECGMIRLTPSASGKQVETKSGLDLSDGEKGDEDAIEDDDDDDEEDEENDSDSSGNQKRTDGTPNSTGSGAVARHKKRTLSSTLHPESSARKIIRTIPLDPQPISARDSGDYGEDNQLISSSFLQKVINPTSNNRSPSSQGSPPKLGAISTSPLSNQGVSPVEDKRLTDVGEAAVRHSPLSKVVSIAAKENGKKTKKPSAKAKRQSQPQAGAGKTAAAHSSNGNVLIPANNSQLVSTSTNAQSQAVVSFANPDEELDQDRADHSPTNGLDFDIDNWDSDMLWKDIDSVMNQFGFHKE